MKDIFDENYTIDKGLAAAVIIITFVVILLSTSSAPILDSKRDPFIVKKIKASAVYSEKAKYYGKIQQRGIFPPKAIILDKNAFNVGDTIFIK